MELVWGVSPALKARTAGALYLLSVLTAVYAEFVARGRLGLAAIFVPIAGYAAVTVILFSIFKPVDRHLSWLAVCCGLIGLAFEALQWKPGHINAGMVFHGFFCLQIGCLMILSGVVPRILGALMALAGLLWLSYLVPWLSQHITAVGILAEGLPMLWLLFLGLRDCRR